MFFFLKSGREDIEEGVLRWDFGEVVDFSLIYLKM